MGHAAGGAELTSQNSLKKIVVLLQGDVVIAAKQTIGFDPPGVTSAVGGATFVVFRHQATLRKTSDGSKITAFEPTFLEAGETRWR